MGDYKLKFLFANHDGVIVDVSFPETTTVVQVKEALLNQHWPEDKFEKASGPAGLRLLCMGKMLEDSKTLAEMKIPRYEHATPVNISLLPKGKTYSENTTPGVISTPTKPVGYANGGAAHAQTPHQAPGGGGCCTIS